MEIAPGARAALPELSRHRRYLHRIPEEGLREVKTQRYLLDVLAECRPDLLAPIGDTGVRAVFRGQGSGRALAFRADMDALNIEEGNHHDFVSRHPGCMHACGHDGHMAVLLCLAQYLADHRGKLSGDVVLLFQPAEESVGGAQRLIEQGALRDPDVAAIYALHMMPDLPVGTIGTALGPLMAGTNEFDITITGQAAHGALPHLGVDAVMASAHLLEGLQSLITRAMDPYQPVVLTVGKLTAGERRNIVADKARLECTMRAFDLEAMDRLKGGVQQLLRGLEASWNVRCAYEDLVYYPPVVNDEAETRHVLEVLGDRGRLLAPKMIAEDFSFYQQAVPGVFLFLGCQDSLYHQPLHSPHFDFDEEALLYGLDAFIRLIPLEGTE